GGRPPDLQLAPTRLTGQPVPLDLTVDPELAAEVLALPDGEHVCLVYDDDPAEQLGALLPFFRHGLESGNRCIYVADDSTVGDIATALSEYGVDVAWERDRGALQLWTGNEWRDPGRLDPVAKAERVRGLVERSVSDGFAG